MLCQVGKYHGACAFSSNFSHFSRKMQKKEQKNAIRRNHYWKNTFFSIFLFGAKFLIKSLISNYFVSKNFFWLKNFDF